MMAAEWSGAEWLIPYILSFTTTAWWNFARTATFSNVRTQADAGQMANTEIRSLIKACTVPVLGQYNQVVLVITDGTRNDYGQHGLHPYQ